MEVLLSETDREPLTEKRSDTQVRPTAALRAYQHPPVHEVIFSVTFLAPLHESALHGLGDALERQFPHATERQLSEVRIDAAEVQTRSGFDGWILSDSEPPSRVLLLGFGGWSYHVVRPGSWPSGSYPGWEQILPEVKHLIEESALREAYGNAKIERAGLRYLNRIAVPDGSAVLQWLKYGIEVPTILEKPWTFNFRESWVEVRGHPHMSVSVGAAKIEIPDQAFRSGNYGLLLDIEVFNLWKSNAPEYDQLVEWANEAHGVENEIFENLITDQLRERFEEIRLDAPTNY